MKQVQGKLLQYALAASLSAMITVPQLGFAQVVEEEPSAFAMTGDLVVLRPALVVVTLVGSAVFLVSLPFSAAGGNVREAADTLVVGPAKATFVRCLGCVKTGRKQHLPDAPTESQPVASNTNAPAH